MQGCARLPRLEGYDNVRSLANEMLAQKQIAVMPNATDLASRPTNDARWAAIREAHQVIDAMYWGPRLSVEDATATIRAWISAELG